MTPAEAIEAAELAEAEIRYRNQLAREMAAAAYERGQVDGYLRAVADVKGRPARARRGRRTGGPALGTRWPRSLRGHAPGRLSRPRALTASAGTRAGMEIT